MAYKITVSPWAQKEIENAIEYYALYSADAPRKLVAALKETYAALETSPLFRVRYKNIRGLKIKNFPYSLFFIVNDTRKTVRVLSCFHNKRNPNKRPRV